MALNDATAIALATLWDGRLQVLADTPAGIMSKTKVAAQPGAGWTNWTHLPTPTFQSAQGAQLVCAVQQAGGNVSIFCNGEQALPGAPGTLVNTTPVIVFTGETEGNPFPGASDWSLWPDTPEGYTLWAGAVLGGQLSASPDIGYQAARGPIQLWAMPSEGAAGLQTMLTGSGGEYGDWGPFKPSPPQAGGVLWPLYGPNSSNATQQQALWLGTNINPNPGTQPFLTLYITTTEINFSFGEHQEPFEWSSWKEFSPQLAASTGGAGSLAAGVLPGGEIQAFVSDCSGELWTIWQTQGSDNTLAWPSAWNKFPLPPGKKLKSLNPGSSDYTPPEFLRTVLAIGQTITGELQLFAIDSGGTVWTTWKESTLAGAPWTSWEEF